jgi:outer membrane immunogenic protein
MKEAILTLLVAGLAGATPTMAADMRAPAPAVKAPPAVMTSWAGPYVGVHLGYLAAGGETTFPGTDEFHFIDPKGFAGGVMAGTAMQWGRLVAGVEGDLSYVAAKATLDTGFAPNPAATQLQTTINWNSHVRGRLGYGFDQALLFVAAGVAFAGVENKAFDNTAGVTSTWQSTRVGWTVGAGVDYRIASQATIRLEYLYDNYGTETLAAQTFGFTTFPTRDHKLDTHTLRAGVNWRF